MQKLKIKRTQSLFTTLGLELKSLMNLLGRSSTT
jgi:hypothetical protein